MIFITSTIDIIKLKNPFIQVLAIEFILLAIDFVPVLSHIRPYAYGISHMRMLVRDAYTRMGCPYAYGMISSQRFYPTINV